MKVSQKTEWWNFCLIIHHLINENFSRMKFNTDKFFSNETVLFNLFFTLLTFLTKIDKEYLNFNPVIKGLTFYKNVLFATQQVIVFKTNLLSNTVSKVFLETQSSFFLIVCKCEFGLMHIDRNLIRIKSGELNNHYEPKRRPINYS